MAKVGIEDDCKDKANHNNEDEQSNWAHINAKVKDDEKVFGNQGDFDSY